MVFDRVRQAVRAAPGPPARGPHACASASTATPRLAAGDRRASRDRRAARAPGRGGGTGRAWRVDADGHRRPRGRLRPRLGGRRPRARAGSAARSRPGRRATRGALASVARAPGGRTPSRRGVQEEPRLRRGAARGVPVAGRRPPPGGRWPPGAPGSGACAPSRAQPQQRRAARRRRGAPAPGTRCERGGRRRAPPSGSACGSIARSARPPRPGPRPPPVDQGHVGPLDRAVRPAGDQVDHRPRAVRATTRRPEVPLSSRCTMPGRSGAPTPPPPGRARSGYRARARRPGSAPWPGPGMHHQPGRLVHHDEVGVLVDDAEDARPARARATPGVRLGSWPHSEDRPQHQAPGRHHPHVDVPPARRPPARPPAPGRRRSAATTARSTRTPSSSAGTVDLSGQLEASGLASPSGPPRAPRGGAPRHRASRRPVPTAQGDRQQDVPTGCTHPPG